jgi:hypothetical protein
MDPSKERYYRVLFGVAAVYDILLGIIFLFFRPRAFATLGLSDQLPPVNGYLALLGAFVLVIGVAYALIARGDLQRNGDLILVGALYKLAYASTAFYYWGVPHIVFSAVFGVADAVFFLLMAECCLSLRKLGKSAR